MDVEQLKEDLDFIEKIVLTLPPKAVEVSQEVAAYEQAVQNYLNKVKGMSTTAKDMVEKVEEALSALKARATDEQPILEGGMKGVESAWDDASKDLEEGRDEIQRSADAAGDAMESLKEKLTDAGDRAESAQEAVSGKFEDLSEGLESGGSELSAAGETAAQEGDGLEEEIAKQGEQFHEAAEALTGQMKTLLGQIQDRMGDAAERLSSLLQSHQGEVGEALEDMVKKSAEIYEAFSEGLKDEQEKLTKAAQELEEAFVSMGETLDRAGEACQNARGEAQEALDKLEAEMPPLETAWKSVKSAADKLGVDVWPG